MGVLDSLAKKMKGRDAEVEGAMQDSYEQGKNEGMQMGYDEAEDDERMFVRQGPTAKDGNQLYPKHVFRVSEIANNNLQKLVLPAFAMSNYSSTPGILEWYYVINRIEYTACVPIILNLVDRWERNKERYWSLGEHNPSEEVNPFLACLEREVTPMEVDSKSRLSGDMKGLEEAGTERRNILKGEKKSKVDDAVRR